MADYAFRTIGDRLEIQRLWEQGYSPKEIAGTVGKSLDVVYTELSRGRDGTRLPDQRLRYSAELAQRKVQQSLERRGRKAGKPTDGKAAGQYGRRKGEPHETEGNQVAAGGSRHHDRATGQDHFSDLPPAGRTGAGPHRKLPRHKRHRENDQHSRTQDIYLGGGRGVLPKDRGR